MKKIFNWTFGSIFRTFGRIIAYLIIGLILSIIISKIGIKLPNFLSIYDTISASSITPTSHRFSVYYGNLNCNVQGTNCYISEPYSSSGWTNYNTAFNLPTGNYGNAIAYLEVKTGTTYLQPGVTYTFNFDHWYTDRNTAEYYSKNEYKLAGSNTGGWEGNSEAFIRNLVCTSGIAEGTITRVSYSCSFQTTKELNYLYMTIIYKQGDKNETITQSIKFETNRGEFIYDNAQVDAINNQTTIINQQTDKIIDKQEEINNSINDLNDTLTDDEINDSDISNSFNYDFSDNSYGPFSTFLTLPLQWIQDILASNQTCSPLVLPLPFVNRNLVMPCMTDFWTSTGSIGTLIQLCWIAVVGVRIFNGLFKLVVDTTSSEDNAEELTKIRSWEL